jgi:ubiquitin-conjugating enzyme E2 Q
VDASSSGFACANSAEDDAVIAAPIADRSSPENHHDEGTAIVEEETMNNTIVSTNINNSNNMGEDITMNDEENGGEENLDDESEYEYEDDDDAAFSGFLLASNTLGPSNPVSSSTAASFSSAPARIVEEDSGTAAVAAVAAVAGPSLTTDSASEGAAPSRRKWREPTREAVNMSLRAQQETSGSKRRLAQDLYRIMNQDTEEAGFSLAPQSEDSMELWTIKLFQFDPDSNLAKDMMVLGIDHIELEMKFPEQYPFEPPFVRVVKPRFKRQTGFVMNGALCMELLTKDGWNPINDIESVIVSIRSLLVVGDGRLQAASELSDTRYEALLKAAQGRTEADESGEPNPKKARTDDGGSSARPGVGKGEIGSYTAAEAQSAYSHLSDYHKKKGWDTSGWWARKG